MKCQPVLVLYSLMCKVVLLFPIFIFELELELDASVNPSHPTDDIGEES